MACTTLDAYSVSAHKGNFAIGAGFNAVRMSLSVDDAPGVNFEGTVDSDFVGLLLYGKVMF